MSRRLNTVLRVFSAIAMAAVGYGAGSVIRPSLDNRLLDALDRSQIDLLSQLLTTQRLLVSVSFAMIGFSVGYVLAPALLRPFHAVYEELREVPPANLVGGTVGLTIALMLSALLAIPLHLLPAPWGLYLPLVVAFALGYVGVAIVGGNPAIYMGLLRGGSRDTGAPRTGILLDTSVIIDGRVGDVAETGFLGPKLLVPRFVLTELQQVADSPDALRRNRGRRGLEVLNRLQGSQIVSLEIDDTDYPGSGDVDRKLVRLAEAHGVAVMTNDYNLNKVAELQGIRILNLNELANAVKTLVLPGEPLTVELIQEGKEAGQGVGYLDDGTMVIVEEGRGHIGETLDVNVTRVLQTAMGRMIFAGLPEHASS
jgi:uncharacterized protein YacL